ncbi:cyclase family protein [Roseiconus lacunae]|uniref:cyclase family protein n=1 Tax=Roseiconus lacunae TaxID=2605694 RepID=UPI001E2B88C2|nr:cyclase family protein [Roseiconus lacunae]MCD0460435.1 cyclase family protein [Roseiconus lacunae]
MKRGLLIGAGYFSHFHLDAWKRLPGAEIIAVCDVELEKARQAADEFDIESVFDDVDKALRQTKVDFVDIATGPNGRIELMRQVLDHSVAVICQKPLSHTYEGACELVDMATRHPAPVMVHENFRFQPWYREIHRIIESGVIGDRIVNLSMRTRMGDGWGEDAYLDRQPYFRTMPRLLIHETGVHFIDTFRYLAGEPIDCFAELRRHNSVIVGEDACHLRLHFRGGAVATWDADRYHESLSDQPRYTFGELLVEADGGSLWLNNEGEITLKPLGRSAERHDYQPSTSGFAGDCVFACQQHFLDVLEGRVECETSPQEYLKTLRVVEAAYESHRTGQVVALSGSASMNDSPDVIKTSGRVVDLSLPITPAMRGVSIDSAKRLETDGWNATNLSLYSHAGTHMDAPRHFLPEGATLQQQDLSVCVGPARVIDLTPIEPKQPITVGEFQRAAGEVAPGERLLLRTDWHHRYGTPDYRDALPRISIELAQWLVAHRVAMIGVEPPSVADVNHAVELTEVHQTLFRGGVLIVEGLAHLDQLTQPIVQFIALPLPIVGGDGCPVRAIAIETPSPSSLAHEQTLTELNQIEGDA